MTEHKFGGTWTEVKLDAVEYYLQCFSNALSRLFDTWYIDAFAGTGDRTAEVERGGIFEGRPLERTLETFDGSARRALAITPSFSRFVFMEKDRDRCSALERLRTERPHADIEIRNGEANEELRELLRQPPWSHGPGSRSRGVVFLDPYALQVEWSTLEVIAKTQTVDVWYLFPLRDVTRQLALKQSGIGPKEKRLDLVLGPNWRNLYSTPKPIPEAQTSLFDTVEDHSADRNVDMTGLEQWFKRELQTLFPFVTDPLPLLSDDGRRIFSLYLAVSNPGKPAINLAKKFARHVMRNYGKPASRRRSGP